MQQDHQITSALSKIIEEIKFVVHDARADAAKTVNLQLLKTYWQIGKIISHKEQEKESITPFILDLSKALTKELGKGFSRSNLFNMKNFYQKYPSIQTLSGQLTWSHYCELLGMEDVDKRSFYEKESINSNWSVRELKRQVNSALFERLLLSKGEINKKKVLELSKEGLVIKRPEDLIKNPYVFEFLGIAENKPILEKDLERKLIRYLEEFLLELGRGFMFVGSQQRITIDNTHHYVDMVFYNKILRAYILIDLKLNKLKAADIGQINMYLNYYKTEVNESIDNDPIGIILCADENEIVAEYVLGGLTNQIFASRYTYYLPNKEELILQVQQAIERAKDEEE